MAQEFEDVDLTKAGQYDQLWQQTPYHSLDYTLTNLWGWQEYYGLEWLFAYDLCWIRQIKPQPVYWAPVGDWKNIDWNIVLSEFVSRFSPNFVRVPQILAELWQTSFSGTLDVLEDRGQWEYLYSSSDLANLSGNRFHKKKNHVNSFIKAYGEPDYRVLGDAMVEDVLAVQDDWCQWHECESSPSLRAENDAINRVLSHWDQFGGLVGGSLYIEDKMVAFSVGERLDDQNIGVHFEKGLNGFRGVYQTINREFVRHAGREFLFVNRAQDLGEEGLRQAKESYLPADFVRKVSVSFAK